MSPDRFEIEWTVGVGERPAANLLPPAEGLAIFAGLFGVPVREVTRGPDSDR
ncbi:MAG TPA: hypothetical protein VH092_00340 [Urbifossiella sp.]|jgi:hypothetical protein|nr:hypothetical protein [Urbifossiella sp.]